MNKRLAVLLLSGVMTLSLAACAAAPAAPASPEAPAAAPAAAEETAPAEDVTAAEETASAVEVTEAAADPSGWPVIHVEVSGLEDMSMEGEIEKAMNDYLVSLNAGVQVDLVVLTLGERATSLTLMLTDPNNPIDLFCWRFYSTVESLVDNEQIISLEPYRDIYPEMFNLFPEKVYQACQVGGEQYSIPTAGSFGNFDVYELRKDVAEELGIADRDGERISFDEMKDIMNQAEALHPEMGWICSTEVTPIQGIDTLGDPNWLGVLMDRGFEQTEIVNYYDTEEFGQYCRQCREWADTGIIRDEPLLDYIGDLMNDGVCGGNIFESYSIENARSLIQGMTPNYEFCFYQLTDPGCDNTCVDNGWNISSVCQNPDAAAKLLNLFYTDETLARLLILGIEGTTYVVDENGCAQYPEGKDATNVGWNLVVSWLYMNQCLSIPFGTDYTDYFTDMTDFWTNPEVKYSNGLGFVFDNSAVFDQQMACQAVVDEYRKALLYGQVDVDETLEKFRAELHDAGIDEIIAEKQSQFEAFLALGAE